MKQPLSPLRYPGGKAALAPFVAYLIDSCSKRPRDYAEAFCGGAGVGLHLLHHEHVERVFLNDLDERIWAFWHSVLFETEGFVERVQKTPVTVESWHEQRLLLADSGATALQRGFATFFLNRTNRSGILRARPIGGLEQTGQWKIDARYNVSRLIERLDRLSRYRNRIVLSRRDGADFVRELEAQDDVFIYADPPYLTKGAYLYLNAMGWEDHGVLAGAMQESRHPWLVTYDDDDRVEKLYPRSAIARYRLKHTAGRQRVGNEMGVFSNRLKVKELMRLPSGDGEWLRKATRPESPSIYPPECPKRD